ncbi:universal stress protein [Hymenobacter radiodurans]|uniref:universal stress protein n=1 Tax=Hymenobacter radiodurans TaxID=2496028 RepID=UPI0010587EC1|nr:universal stress protein [Hymenobacter radiodurans]
MKPAILVLTDFFAGANRALALATAIAQPLGARLVLLHVERTSLLDPELLTGEVAVQSKEDTDLALDHLIRDLPVFAEAEVASGRVEEAVLESTKQHNPIMIVLSRPPDENTPDELVTTTALNLLKMSPYPLLIVPPHMQSVGVPKRIVLAADGDGFELSEHAAPIRDLFNALQIDLTVVHITESATRHTTRQAIQTVERTGLTRDLPQVHPCHVCHADAGDGILQAVAEQRADILVMIARQHRFLERLFRSSVTGEMILHSPVPVLVLPAQRESHRVGRGLSSMGSIMSRFK